MFRRKRARRGSIERRAAERELQLQTADVVLDLGVKAGYLVLRWALVGYAVSEVVHGRAPGQEVVDGVRPLLR